MVIVGVGSSKKADELERAIETEIDGLLSENSQDPCNWEVE